MLSRTSETLSQWGLLCVEQWKLRIKPLHLNKAPKKVQQININVTVGKLNSAYMENCLSLASMLRCLMHILVSADPMSLVPPERQQNTVSTSDTQKQPSLSQLDVTE